MKTLRNAIDYLSMNDRNGNYEEIYTEIKEGYITINQAKMEVIRILALWIHGNLTLDDIEDIKRITGMIQSLVNSMEMEE